MGVGNVPSIGARVRKVTSPSPSKSSTSRPKNNRYGARYYPWLPYPTRPLAWNAGDSLLAPIHVQADTRVAGPFSLLKPASMPIAWPPPQVEATYRLYLIVSPDTSSYSRIGYGLQDQLIYASPTLSVDEDAEESCPVVEVETAEEETSGVPRRIIPTKATGTLALALAAAAAGREL